MFITNITKTQLSIYHLHIRIPEKNISNFEYLIVLDKKYFKTAYVYILNLHLKALIFNILLPISNLVIISNVILIIYFEQLIYKWSVSLLHKLSFISKMSVFVC